MSQWVPLEANPELFAAWCSTLGLDGARHSFYDVFGFDDELLAMIPQPVNALLFLFPLTDAVEERHRADDASRTPPEGLLWFKQTIGNACGTIGLLHAIANSAAKDAVIPGSALDDILTKARATTAEERVAVLANSEALRMAHAAVADDGQTAAPDAHDPVNLHFVAFVRANGKLVELDGRRTGPIEHDVAVPTQDDLLKAAVQFVQQYYVAANPDELGFNMIALSGAPP
ncbi:ubiquitinyl hydrolase 1 [Malassezia cuniculi]|uniref:Ubiquitin carboxyl-terminal hydrolase n=1 Tax=Malassezia cuniculi TaxID=948313 RepID=A0AAF0J501_9BASI|nr:ubiquitinyl hydrolase 1 [Malassezia cuniculi]